jgi:high frequency lysogenization protein
MSRSPRDRALALAGVSQAAYLVQQVARRGGAEPAATEASIASVFKLEAEDVEDVYGGIQGLTRGINVLRAQLGGGQSWDAELVKYVVGMLQLERKLMRNTRMLGQLQAGIQVVKAQAASLSTTHPAIIARLGELYQETISNLRPRIIVSGEPSHLANADNASLIRALLLAGIRSAVLWRQLGGSRLQLLLGRAALLRQVEQLRAQSYSG